MCYFTSDYSKDSHNNSVTYVHTNLMDAIEIINISEDFEQFFHWWQYNWVVEIEFGFTFEFLFFLALKTRSVKSGLDCQTKNPLKKLRMGRKSAEQSGKMRKSTSVTVKYIERKKRWDDTIILHLKYRPIS